MLLSLQGLSLVAASGGYSPIVEHRLQESQHVGSVVAHGITSHAVVALQHVESSWTRD